MQSKNKNTQKKSWLLGAETLAGICAGFMVTPLNVVVDKSVILYSNGTSELWPAAGAELKMMVSTPWQFLKSFQFRWMYLVYAPTYTASNLADHYHLDIQISQPIQKLLVVFGVNTTCSLIKDKKFAQFFGKVNVKPFPIPSLGLLFMRDIVAMASAFTIPPILGEIISDKFKISSANGQRIAQIGSPLAVQVVCTPLHLLALDLYNRENLKFAERLKLLKVQISGAILMRMLRFLPAYGLGGIANIELRKWLKSQVPNQI